MTNQHPPIPPGYRLATEQDRQGPKPLTALFADYQKIRWLSPEPNGIWITGIDYIVPGLAPKAEAAAVVWHPAIETPTNFPVLIRWKNAMDEMIYEVKAKPFNAHSFQEWISIPGELDPPQVVEKSQEERDEEAFRSVPQRPLWYHPHKVARHFFDAGLKHARSPQNGGEK